VYILDPADSMFTVIGQRFTREQTATYGTDHFYSSDTFNENLPPTNDSTFLNDVSKKVYQSMAAVDPKAVWVMQGWMFSFQSKFWQPTQIKALLNAVPNDHMLILDLYSENKPMWNKTEAYYGKPWIWCMLHNFGGNISLYGRMSHVANDPVDAHHSPAAGKMEGIGLTPEAIEQNPALYELMLEHVWNDKNIDLDSWLKDYAYRRYGAKNEEAEKAWIILKNTVYNGGITEGGNESIITSRPTFAAYTKWANTRKAYRPADLVPAWRHFIKAVPVLKNSEGFQYDLVDVTRQVLVNYADTLQRGLAKTYQSGDAAAFNRQSAAFITLMEDIDRLLATRKDFLLGRWLNMAKARGNTPEEKALYERNARNLITLWGDKNARLHEYSCRQWSGMLNGFYKPRWQAFFNYVQQSMQEKKPIDEKVFEERIKDWEWSWVNAHELYTDQPKGDAVTTAQEMSGKYGPAINEIYGLK